MRKTIGMRGIMRLIALVCMLAVSATVMAQKPRPYDSDFKYRLFSNWTIGGSYQFSRLNGENNNGISMLATKRIGDYWRLRYTADINGFKANSTFDRYGKAMAGICLDFIPYAYLFIDQGIIVNPSSGNLFNVAADAGIGGNVNFGKHSILYAEFGTDRVQINNNWNSTMFARIGYQVRLGVVKKDMVDQDIEFHQREQVGVLTQQNRTLSSENERLKQVNNDQQTALDRALTALDGYEKRLQECTTNNERIQAECLTSGNSNRIFFEYASSDLTSVGIDQIAIIAKEIRSNNKTYRVEGYSSASGNPANNQRLSLERAMTVVDVLVDIYDIPRDRLIPIGNGISEDYDLDSGLNQHVDVIATTY